MLMEVDDDDPRCPLTKGFVWSSICINQDLMCRRHRDTHHEGMSAIIARGHFKGGKLRHWGEHMGAGFGAESDLPENAAVTLPIDRKLQVFLTEAVHMRRRSLQGDVRRLPGPPQGIHGRKGENFRPDAKALLFCLPATRRAKVHRAPVGYPCQWSTS